MSEPEKRGEELTDLGLRMWCVEQAVAISNPPASHMTVLTKATQIEAYVRGESKEETE